MAVAVIPELDKAADARKPEGTRPKLLRQVSRPDAPNEEKKKKKRRLRRLSCLDQDASPSAPIAEKVPAEVFTGVDPTMVCLLRLTPMGVFLLKLTPMGVILLKLTLMGVIMHHLLSAFLMRMKKRKKKFRLFARIAGVIEVIEGIVIFLLQLYLLSLAFRIYL
jgi:hypothetical protein